MELLSFISIFLANRYYFNSIVAVHSLALVFVEESGVIGVVSALLAFFFGRLVLFLLFFT